MRTERLETVFETLRARGEAALIAYITAGDPSLERLPDILRLLQDAGVDMVEVGFPFSDPLADGPVIQAAMHRALQAGTTLPRVLETVAAVSPTLHTPLIAFTYYNPVQRYGLGRFAQEAVAAGFTACLMTDTLTASSHASRQSGACASFCRGVWSGIAWRRICSAEP
jgi:tryptophan synthase alpha chain